MKRIVLLLAFLSLVLVPPWAQAQVSVALSLDREEAALSDSVRMEVKVSGARSLDSPPVIGGLEPFQVRRGESSSRVEIINGRISAGVDYTYYIQPLRTGTFVVGPARVEVEGKVYKSETLTLKILKSPPSRSGGGGPIFLKADLSSRKAYVEEQVIYTLKLYLKSAVSDITLQLPEQDHLVFTQLGEPRESRGVYEGSRYRIVEVPYGLMALKPGKYEIAPSRMSMTAYDSGRSMRGFFDDPFFRTGRPVNVSSQALTLEVMPLPDEGKPPGFSGLVGSFRMEASLAPQKIKVGESATLTVRVRGRGNVNRIPDLGIPELNHIKVYGDEPVLEVHKDAKGFLGVKTMKWALVPDLQGDYRIPPLSLSFFDPRTRKYRTVKTRTLNLVVIPGKGEMFMVKSGRPGKGMGAGPSRQGVKVVGRDILPPHTSVRGLETSPLVISNGILIWGSLLLPFLLYVSAFVGLRFRRMSARAMPAQRARKAAGKLLRQCRQGGADPETLGLLIRDYFNDRFGLSLASLTPEDAFGILVSKGVPHPVARRLRDLLTEIENSIYTGQRREMDRLARELPLIIREIEGEIR